MGQRVIPLREQIDVVKDYIEVLEARHLTGARPEPIMRPIIQQWEAVLRTLRALYQQKAFLEWLQTPLEEDDAEEAEHR